MKHTQDILSSIVILFMVTVLMWQTQYISVSQFEPMGSAMLPRLVLGCMALLAVSQLARALWGLRTGPARKTDQQDAEGDSPVFIRSVRLHTLVTLLLLAAYVAVLTYELLNYYLATFLFVPLLTAYLSRWNAKYTGISLGIVGCILGLLYALSKGMGVILPTM